MRARISADGHKLSQTEVNRRFSDKHHSIDEEMKELFSQINWKRRREAESDIIKWVNTYCIGIFLEDPPPPKGEQVLRQMWKALDSHENYMILMGRGSGKSVYELCTTMASISQGAQKFIVIISNNTKASANLLKDIWRMISTNNSAFQQDYPEVCGPYKLANGSLRRRQLFNGQSTELSKTATEILLPRLYREDGREYPTSGSIITCRGLNSGIRGLRNGTQRVTCVLLDDLQDKDIAHNPEQVEKLMDTIKKDIIPLAGKDRLSIIQTATPICPEDLVEKIKEDKTWKTTLFPAIISYPCNTDLWKQYFKLYDAELMEDEVCHDSSLQFYRDNFDAMNEGAEVFNPTRFSTKDGHLSMIQKLMELEHSIGKSAFQAEYQMEPVKMSFSLDISPRTVVAKVNQFKRGEIPDGYVFVAASTDLNLSYALTTTIVAFKPDMTAVVVDHFISKANVDFKAPESEFNQQVHKCLLDHGKRIKSLGIKIDGWGIDANGTPFDAVTNFARQSVALCGVPAVAMAGKASHMFSGFIRSRLRDEVNGTLLCGDQAEHIKAGAGKKYMYWNSDRFREQVQKAFLAPLGSFGSLSLYDADKDEHTEFANQFCNEKLLYVKHRPDGRDEYAWKTAEPHDYLDATAQAFAIAASQGISGQNSVASRRQAGMKRQKIRPRLKIV